MKPPAQAIYDLYTEDSPRSFREDLEAHLVTGVVVSHPNWMFMARPVQIGAGPDDIRNPWMTWERPDCWYVYAAACRPPITAAGLVKKCLCHAPYVLPKVAWHRHDARTFRIYSTAKLLRWAHLSIVTASNN